MLGQIAVSLGKWCCVFQRIVVPLSLGVKHSKKAELNLVATAIVKISAQVF
jgi:hypothetical protein